MERKYLDNHIRTYTGRRFWPLEPAAEDVDIRDIARGLAMECRYNGQIPRFYSVAEHSVLVSFKAGLHGLLHDAAEAYIKDIPRPIKALFPGYREAEDRLLAVIYDALGIPVPAAREVLLVKEADNRVLATEMVQLPHDRTWGEDNEPYTDLDVVGWRPEVAEALFLSRWRELRRVSSPLAVVHG